MAEKEGKPLLTEKEGTAPSSYGGESSTTVDAPPAYEDIEGTTRAGEEARMKRAVLGKKDQLPRRLSLEKVDEDGGERQHPKPSKFMCQNLSSMFGVKSYLHHFYETHSYKDPDMYEEDDTYRYLLHPPTRRRRRCTSIWWKVFVWIGANFLVFGVIAVLVGYLVPHHPVIVEDLGPELKMVDKEAGPYNLNLDVCKLVGLILFCIGGLTLTVALLFPSFLHHYCGEDERKGEGAFRVATAEKYPIPPLSPLDQKVPAFSTVTNVQPDRSGKEAILTQEGMVEYKD